MASVLLLFWLHQGSHLLGQAVAHDFQASLAVFESGNYPACIQDFEAMLADSTLPSASQGQVHFFLGQAYFQVGRDAKLARKHPGAFGKAFNHLSAAQGASTQVTAGELAGESLQLLWPYLFNQGVAAYNRGKFEEAWTCFNQVGQIDPQNYRNQLALSYACWHKGDTLQAVRVWQHLKRAHEADPETLAAVPEVKTAIGLWEDYMALDNPALRSPDQEETDH